MNNVKFLPTYVGAKTRWLKKLKCLEGDDIVELFCGSAVISCNYAKTAILNDIDPYVYKILLNYDKLITPEKFSLQDYYEHRKLANWWQYIYCLQKMSFSGVFRYSKNGYNVPPKKNKECVEVSEDYKLALDRYNTLKPIVTNKCYTEFDYNTFYNKTVILDPPYEGSQASYNIKFDNEHYYKNVQKILKKSKYCVIFDRLKNIKKVFGDNVTCYNKTMRVNGKYDKDIECMVLFHNFGVDLDKGESGEKIFYEKMLGDLEFFNDNEYDFTLKNNHLKCELKTDYYDLNKTSNFFIERYSNDNKKTDGGPWQSAAHGVDYYMYYFIKNDFVYIYNNKKLIKLLDKITADYPLINVRNQFYNTLGYKVDRTLLHSALTCAYNFNEGRRFLLPCQVT